MHSSDFRHSKIRYIPLLQSLGFLLGKPRLLGWSLLLFCITIAFTWIGYQFCVNFVDGLTAGFFATAPDTESIWGWIKYGGWVSLKWLYLFISRIIAFYLAFLLAYTVTTPGYVFLSTSAEKLHAGERFEEDAPLTIGGILRDIFEGLKIACFGIVITIAALLANFVPLLGPVLVFLLYIYFSALMFLDYPASRRRWSLGRKLQWLKVHGGHSFRLGLLPALVSMIPILNVFLIALLFPVLTVHATLNFADIEGAKKIQPAPPR